MSKKLISFMLCFTLFASMATAQEKVSTSGTVTDEQGAPLVGVSIVEDGTSNGSITDLDGHFTIQATKGAVLKISYMGYATQFITRIGDGSKELIINLIEETTSLRELVVVGYSSQRKESLTGSLQQLKSDKIITATTPSVENLLSSKVPGVYVAPGSGQPGSRGSIIIRGKSSINGVVDPLWVIDGVIVGRASNYTLNPNDIESMTILKDAASTAIYGSQGANGVIVVTTKKAAAGSIRVDVSAKVGLNSLDNGNLEVMNGAELYDLFKSFPNQEAIKFTRWKEDLRNVNYNWWDLATKTGLAQDYNVSISGGSDKLKSYFSTGYYNEDGAVQGYNFQRYSLRFRSEYKPVSWLTVKPMITGSRRDVDDRQYSVTAMYVNLPWDSPYLEDGKPTPHKSSTWVNSNNTNYLYDLQWNKSNNTRYSFLGNMDFDVRLTGWLTFSSVNNIAWDGYFATVYTDPRSNAGSGVNGRLQEYRETTEHRYTNQLLRFNKTFDKHSFNALAAYEFSDYRRKTVDAIGTGFVAGFAVLDVTAVPEKTKGLIIESAIQSVFANVHYAYDDKYLAQVSVRRDGASNFGPNAKYANFFSLSGGWLINKESFFNVGWVDLLKLRVSYGSVGNRPDALYPQYDLYSVAGNYNGKSAALISQIGNDALTWEKTYTLGFGLDFNFMDRFRLTLDYYNKNTDNILFRVPVSGLFGVTSVWKNVGELENNGIEANFGVDIVKTKDWKWSVDANIGANTNKLKSLYDGVEQIINTNIGGPAGSISRILKPGYSIDTWYSREWAGVNPENGAPQWYTTNKDTKARELTSTYAQADEVICGSYNPDFYGGFSTSASWKQIDFNAIFGYSSGGTIYNYSRQEYDSDGTYTDRNQMKLMKGWSRWEKSGDVATHPVASYGNQSKANNVSTRYLEDASYLKLRSLSLGYNLALPKYGFKNVRFAFTAENLLTFTKYSGVDPEIPARNYTPETATKSDEGHVRGVTGAANYPITRKFVFSLNLSF